MPRNSALLFAFLVVVVAAPAGGCDESAGNAGPQSDVEIDAGTDATASDASEVDGADVEPQPSGWTEGSPLGLGDRQEIAVVALDGEVYLIGGFNGTLEVVDSVEVYNPERDEWRTAAPTPVPMHHANAVVHDGKIYVLGFLSDFAFTQDGRSYVYEPDTDEWSPVANMPDGTGRGSSAIASIGSEIIVAGGVRGAAVTVTQSYDPATDSWSPRADMPIRRDHMAFGVIDGLLYVTAGRDRSIGAHSPRTDVYDPVADTWTEAAAIPTSRAGVAAAVHDGLFYVFGGEGFDGDPSGVFPQVEVYDPTTDAWEALDEMPRPIHGTGAVTIGDAIYIPGGADEQAFQALDNLQIYRP